MLDTMDVDVRRGVLARVTGTAYESARVSIDPHDPLVPGLVLR